MRHPAAWLMMFAYLVCGYTDLGFIQTHFVPLVQGLHVSSSFIAALLGTYAGSNIMGTLLVGYFSDRFRLPYVLAGLYAMRIAGLLFLLLGTFHAYALIVFAVLFGFTDFAAISPVGALCAKIFGRDNLGAIFGAFSTFHQIGAMMGSLLPGLLFDHFHDYTVSIYLAGGLLAASIGSAVTLRIYARE
ncbi:MAG: MFS transporter [Alicyclobacillaceae bacterium]|nr:MFS transporter [Alicyclobacillaceae bacterium]